MKAKLTCITPVAIGGGLPPLSPYTDYILQEDHMMILDQRAFASALHYNLSAYQQYKASLLNTDANNRIDFDLNTFINAKFNSSTKDSIIKTEIPQFGFEKGEKIEVNDIARSVGRPYIPGSSIKGALKTALLFEDLIQNDFDNLKPFISKIELIYLRVAAILQHLKQERFSSEPNKIRIKQLGKDLSNIVKPEIIDYFISRYEETTFGSDFRSQFLYNQLRISDSNTLNSNEIVGVKLVRVSLVKNEQNIPIGSLAIASGSQLECDIAIIPQFNKRDSILLDGNIHELIQRVNTHITNVLACESDILNDSKLSEFNKAAYDAWFDKYESLLAIIDEENTMLIRIGSGKSIFYQTALPAVRLYNGEAFNKLRLMLDLGDTTIDNFPCTITLINNSYNSLGYLKIKI